MPKLPPKKVIFLAKKNVKEPTIVHFNTKDGQVAFFAKKTVQKPQIVSFDAKDKKKK